MRDVHEPEPRNKGWRLIIIVWEHLQNMDEDKSLKNKSLQKIICDVQESQEKEER